MDCTAVLLLSCYAIVTVSLAVRQTVKGANLKHLGNSRYSTNRLLSPDPPLPHHSALSPSSSLFPPGAMDPVVLLPFARSDREVGASYCLWHTWDSAAPLVTNTLLKWWSLRDHVLPKIVSARGPV